MTKLEHAEAILKSIAIDIYEYFDCDVVEKGYNDTKKAVKSKKNGKVLECKYCNANGFEWGETSAGWRLFKLGKEHICKGAQ